MRDFFFPYQLKRSVLIQLKKIIALCESSLNQSSKYGARDWVDLESFEICLSVEHIIHTGLVFWQMYIHNDIHDLLFSYVGTLEATQVLLCIYVCT